jgi:hypothetical protein
MKIRLLGVSESSLDCDFKINDIHDVLKVEVSGDTSAYDIFYMVESKTGHRIWVQDITVEEVISSAEHDEFIRKINRFIKKQYKNHLQFKFKFEICL